MNPPQIPQIKICGLTDPHQASACAGLGVDAIGFIFYPKSPRFITTGKAYEIAAALPRRVKAIGVFVNAVFDQIMETVERCGLGAVQLHGQESPELVEQLSRRNLPVIKALFIGGTPEISAAPEYNAAAFLVECAGGALPGGNAMKWDWESARPLGKIYPLVIAGGLSPDNIGRAVESALPDAVDVSSGVESSPGRKDLEKVKSLIEAVKRARIERPLRKIF
ncbi:MAG: phosphoribosylanthranilate isomerase [Desulfobacteraceae bacterium]|nr:MAG: phosphoribosylanthranilate isomerase [Desulfobacteraceae bacterium]